MADANFVVKNGLVANGTFRANSTVVNAAAITATGLTIGAVTVNATNISTGTLDYARLPAGLVNTSANFTYTGTHTYQANVTMSATAIYVAFNESDWGTRWIHMNAGAIGFLTSNVSNWACYSDNSGNFTATGNISAYSDMRLKINVHPLTGALETVKSINGVSYEWKETGKKGIGVIAQELQAVLPELVMESNDGTLSVAYGNLTALLVEAIKELSARVEELEKRI